MYEKQKTSGDLTRNNSRRIECVNASQAEDWIRLFYVLSISLIEIQALNTLRIWIWHRMHTCASNISMW